MDKLAVSIGASFTADPLSLFVPFWSDLLGRSVRFDIVPPAELFQQLLTPGAILHGDGRAPVFLLIRWHDLVTGNNGDDDGAQMARELASAIHAAPGHYTVILCPDEKHHYGAADKVFTKSLEGAANARILSAREVFTLYGIGLPFDTDADEIAHTPYTMEAFAALSGAILRRAIGAQRKPIKLIAVDCDNTLWRGVVGEDGVDELHIDAGNFALQEMLGRQAESGCILVLLSKNDQHDVDRVFQTRRDMVLQREHVLAKGINWRAKSENLIEIAERLRVGEDAILFLDDNPVEIAEMQAALPDICAIQTPVESEALRLFAHHFWPFDAVPATQEDAARVKMYREEAVRADERRAAPSLQSFLASLELEIDIFKAGPSDITRLAQLTQRTNQFNINLKRLAEAGLTECAEQQGNHVFGVRVKDRFGDYGIVGLIGASSNGAMVSAELFMLSCRALGRGVEHAMAAHLGALAVSLGCMHVRFDWKHGPRNEPARAFLETCLLYTSPSPRDS